jgi:hypothetical protein
MAVAVGDDHAMEGGEDKPETRSQKPEKDKPETRSQKPEKDKPETRSQKPEKDKPETRSQKPEEKAKAEVESQKPEEKNKSRIRVGCGAHSGGVPEGSRGVERSETPGSAPPAYPPARAKRAAHPGGCRRSHRRHR